MLPTLGARHRCVALDLPGFGRSGSELSVQRATVPALGKVVEAVADALGWQHFDLVGHDIGEASPSTSPPRPGASGLWCS